MSTILKSVDSFEDLAALNKVHNTHCKEKIKLKNKQTISKHKCCNQLKKRLKKYKLRHDGKEDPEVIDVSQILVATLKIKSPTNRNNNFLDELGENIKPKNYLFKMKRKKPLVVQTEQNDFINSSNNTLETDTDLTRLKPNEMNENTLQKNAFKVMMESRNTSIGSNSLGKEKNVSEDENVIEQRNIKKKRKLILEKMAESKGSLKKKEIEEYKSRLIEKKMKNRAERLKNMLTTTGLTNGENTRQMVTGIKIADHRNAENTKQRERERVNHIAHRENKHKKVPVMKNGDESKNTLKFIDLFPDPTKNLDSADNKKNKISNEDQEFLNKLSPSMKKKENMLCYFKKINKVDDIVYLDSETVENEDKATIKAKLSQKGKKKLKKRNLSLNNKNNIENICTSDINNDIDELTETYNDASKSHENKETKVIDCIDAIRPRRNIKRPKYIDEVQDFSSDEELHIITPKKKKHISNKDKQINCEINGDSSKNTSKFESTKQHKNGVLKNDNLNSQKKSVKMAPIFNVKPLLDPAAIEAKQKFLNSGVPDKIKKIFDKQKNINTGLNCFSTVVHVQQIQLSNISSPKCDYFNIDDEDNDVEKDKLNTKFLFDKLMTYEKKPYKVSTTNNLLSSENTLGLLKRIKQSYPKFPVYRTFKLLKDKSQGVCSDINYRNLDNSIEVMNSIMEINKDELILTLNWTDKYKPMSSKQIIGNFQTTKELKKWLVSWTENDLKIKQKSIVTSDSSDFYQSDTDSTDCIKNYNNLLILTGPVGSGKTSMVYAVASELAMKVLEVNASSKRTGKIMLQDLQEATKSHKVNRGMTSSQEVFQKGQDEVIICQKPKKRGRPKKSLDVNTKRTFPKVKKDNEVNHINYNKDKDNPQTCMSLVLIDDADIVFEQDDGFCSAIVQIVQCSKRPVILIASSNTCPHLQRFFCSAKHLHTRPFQPTMLGTWLDLLCLAEANVCLPGLSARFLEYFGGDIRKTMNFMQFCLSRQSTQETVSSKNSDCFKDVIEDEYSNMSWIESGQEGFENDNNIVCSNMFEVDNVWHQLMHNEINLKKNKYPFNIFNVWWSIPSLLEIKVNKERIPEPSSSVKEESEQKTNLKDISNILEMISIADIFTGSCNETNITDKPWLSIESHSVSEQESFDTYLKINEVLSELSHNLVCNSISNTQQKILNNKQILELPGTVAIRDRDRVVSRHHSLTKYLNQSAVLDRRALALDYWSGSRTLCRIEKSKTDTNLKRNNRFCHYLKSQNILSSNETFDNLCKSLSFN
ncbi:hypothetical protein ACJJTC_014904 [Scirpophaga incertulas]